MEYEALIIGLQLLLDLGALSTEITGDLLLILINFLVSINMIIFLSSFNVIEPVSWYEDFQIWFLNFQQEETIQKPMTWLSMNRAIGCAVMT